VAMHEDAAMARKSVFLGVVAALLVSACAGTQSPATDRASIGPSPSAHGTPSSAPSAVPPASIAPSPSPVAPVPTGVAIEALGLIDVGEHPGGGVWGLLGIEAGYVAWGTFGQAGGNGSFAAWHSIDGQRWTQTFLADQVAPCPDWTERSNLEGFYAAASNGREVVLIGSVLDSPTRTTCDEVQPITLASVDGLTWRRSQPSKNGAADLVWPTADGWQSFDSGTGALWTSVDGLAWQAAGSIEPELGSRIYVARGPDGMLLAARGDRLLTSTDGREWEHIETLPPGFVAASVAGPKRLGESWIVAIDDFDPGIGATWTSTDLVNWRSAPLPNPETAWVVPLGVGWLIYTFWQGRVTGCDPCPSYPAPALSWSLDGTAWTDLEMPPSGAAPFLGSGPPAHGPAGLLAFGWNSSGALQVIRLTVD